ncbi:FecCD family ABC transporter permease [Leptolyngbya sp. AN02str]|uniref:FecCD family ABC transporter permease n=1 Tax=Leptolyngbya sp. AN02str TaxID=3423363 RepID=UPI003D311678
MTITRSFTLKSFWRSLSITHNVRITLLLTVLMVCTAAIALIYGSVPLSLTEIWQALWRQGSSINQTIIWDLRLPRIAIAMTVGAALGMSGALLQGLLRNSLASPFLLGISAGAGLVVVVLVAFGVLLPWVPAAAWLGAVLTTVFVYLLARTPTGIAVERLILAGVAVNSLFGALQTVLLLLSDDGRIQQALNWLIGSFNGRTWAELGVVFPYMALALVVGGLLSRQMNLLSLGDDLAVGLGVSLGRSRLLIGSCATLLAACAVSISGLIGFVGLVVPHGVRLLVGTDHRWVLPLSALGGAWVLTLADLMSRLGSVELPVGAVTALLGAPMFIWLLYRRKENQSLGGMG